MKYVLVASYISSSDIDHFLPHLSSYFFEKPLREGMLELGIPIPRERWFLNLATKGNIGAASIYLMLDELFTSGRLSVFYHLPHTESGEALRFLAGTMREITFALYGFLLWVLLRKERAPGAPLPPPG